jgi:hypothetical protein
VTDRGESVRQRLLQLEVVLPGHVGPLGRRQLRADLVQARKSVRRTYTPAAPMPPPRMPQP